MFSAKERKIFRFSNGEKTVARDPVRVLRKMEATRPPHYDKIVECIKSTDPSKFSPAVDILVPWIENLFGVKSLDDDGQGLTEEEIFGVLNQFMEFVSTKKNEPSELPTSSPSTQDSTHTPAESSLMATSSDCGCGA